MKTVKTLGEWKEWLFSREMLALEDNGHINPEEELSADEVMDMIVEWEGGIASGYSLRSIVSRVYGIKLK